MTPIVKWPNLWQELQTDPLRHVAFTLLALNGLSVSQIQSLNQATIDLEQGWLSVVDKATGSATYPLVTYAREALANLPSGELNRLASSDMTAFLEELRGLETDAHRRLAGAIWFTSEEGQLLLQTSGMSDAPILPLRFTFPFSIIDRLQPREDSDISRQSRVVLQTAADWLYENVFDTKQTLPRRLLKVARQGSAIFVLVSMGVSGLNLIYNIIMGRLLSPADYGQLALVITLQLLAGLLPTAIQTVAARFSARYNAQDDGAMLAVLRGQTARFALRIGITVAVITLALSPLLVPLFQLSSIWLLIPIIVVLPLFVLMGMDRGLLQGLNGFWWLSSSYLAESIIRLGIGLALGLLLIGVGRSLEGAVWGLAQSVLVTWFITWLAMRHFRSMNAPTSPAADSETRAAWLQLGGLTLVALIGQALITNSDFLLVKNFFSPEEAGHYAAVSVLGRIVYFGALPLTTLMIPIVARRQALNEPTRSIFLLLLGGGAAVCGALVIMAFLFAPIMLRLLYGEAYISAAVLFAPYALAASLYTLTNLVITYRIALGKGGETWLPLVAGGAQIVGILLFHETLQQVILVQVVLMAVLLVGTLWRVQRSNAQKRPAGADILAAEAPAG